MTFSSISILLMAIGIASDNLLFAGINGKGLSNNEKYKLYINAVPSVYLANANDDVW
ncbi:MAG: hypothetical protein WKG06_11400 [Segetibacter sp.]